MKFALIIIPHIKINFKRKVKYKKNILLLVKKYQKVLEKKYLIVYNYNNKFYDPEVYLLWLVLMTR